MVGEPSNVWFNLSNSNLMMSDRVLALAIHPDQNIITIQRLELNLKMICEYVFAVDHELHQLRYLHTKKKPAFADEPMCCPASQVSM